MPHFNPKHLFFLSFSSSTAIATGSKKLPYFRCINRIHGDYKATALSEAQKALREYLCATKFVPFAFAELIAQNSLFSLATLFPKIRFYTKTFPAKFRQILRYEPINEFEFFFESIGVDRSEVHRFLAPKTFFFSQDSSALDAAIALSRFGFPWTMIGKLCSGYAYVLRKSPVELSERLCVLKDRYGVDKLALVGIVLAFPRLLGLEDEFPGASDEILRCLTRVFTALGAESCVEGNVDVWYELCCKARFFWDSGCNKTMVVDSMIDNNELFINSTVIAMSRKLEFFGGFGVGDLEEIAVFVLQSPELFGFDLDNRLVSVLGFLEHFGLERHEIQSVAEKYSHVLGRNRMTNLPNIMKAIDLHEWCFDKIKRSNGRLLQTYSLSLFDEGDDEAFLKAWKQCSVRRKNKYELLRGFGFGENTKTVHLLNRICGVRDSLRERFDCLIRLGFKHSDVCLMIVRAPDFISQGVNILEEKVTFLLHEIGLPMQLLVARPKFLHFSCNGRLKSKLAVVLWLRESGLAKFNSIPFAINLPEKKFILYIYKYHPALPKHYLERF